uniref:Cyclin N-terminal domain-containing protein n=1 Tax=Meloidogyne floridensis TaxID=298350 RepID=A0A915NSJ7_9BILA
MMALTCLFLAGKVEETPKKCRDLVQMANDKYPIQFAGINLIDELILLERILLQSIRFDLHVEHPTNAWTFINDSLATSLCLLYEPEVIAVAVLYMSFKMEKIASPLSLEGEEAKMEEDTEWWNIYVQNLAIKTMEDICHKVLDCVEDAGKQLAEELDHNFDGVDLT